MKTAKYILNQRYQFIKKLIEHHKFNLEEVSLYFELPPKQIKNYVYSIYGRSFQIPEDTNFFTYHQLAQHRDKILQDITDPEQRLNLLNDLGYFREPTNHITYDDIIEPLSEIIYINQSLQTTLQNAKEYVKDPTIENFHKAIIEIEKYIPHFEDALNDFNHGFQQTDIQKKYQYSNQDLQHFSLLKNVLNYETTPLKQSITSPENYQAVLELLQDSQNNELTISKLTGLTETLLHQILQKDVVLKHTNNKTEGQLSASERRKKVWELYTQYGSTHGLTQQEIADKLGITRETVCSDLKKYKLEHIDEIDAHMLYKKRHSGETKYHQYQKRIENVTTAYVKIKEKFPDFSETKIKYAIAQQYHIAIETINIILTKEGYINVLETKKELNGTFSKEGSVLANHFGHGGATRQLLNQSEFEYLSKEEMNYRQKILSQQRLTKAILDANPKYQETFIENDYDIALTHEQIIHQNEQEYEDVENTL